MPSLVCLCVEDISRLEKKICGPPSMSGLKIFFQNFKRKFRRSSKVKHILDGLFDIHLKNDDFELDFKDGFCSNG